MTVRAFNMNHFLLSLSCAAILSALSQPCAAQFAKPADAVKYRKGAFSVMAHHFGRLGAMVNEKVPFDAKLAASDAELVAALAPLPFHAFPAGTGSPQTKPEIWSDGAAFKAAGDQIGRAHV
mgnify:FL=1